MHFDTTAHQHIKILASTHSRPARPPCGEPVVEVEGLTPTCAGAAQHIYHKCCLGVSCRMGWAGSSSRLPLLLGVSWLVFCSSALPGVAVAKIALPDYSIYHTK